jgi:hypothetical protein
MKIKNLAISTILLLSPFSTATIMAMKPSPVQSSFSRTLTPEIPHTVEFAGKKVDLDRYDMFERLDRELTSMIYTHGNTLLTIKRANKYFPILAPILKANGIPLDMLYLACIESYLNPRAYSSAKAAGFWQFMPTTGKQYGLEITDDIDERYNIEKSTEAACRYLKSAYSKYGNWESVAASYNGGMGRISSELERQNVSTAYDLYLTDETSRYMFRLLAMKIIMENPKAFGYYLKENQLYQPLEFDTVEVSSSSVDWCSWAQSQGITYMQLRDENPWIRSKTLTNKDGKTYKVKIPKKHSTIRSKQKKSVYNPNWIIK